MWNHQIDESKNMIRYTVVHAHFAAYLFCVWILCSMTQNTVTYTIPCVLTTAPRAKAAKYVVSSPELRELE